MMLLALRSTALAVAALIALSAATPAPSPAPTPTRPAAAAPAAPETTINGYKVETDVTDWNANTGAFTMPKEVRVSRPGSDARGDRAHGNSKNGIFVLEGNV